MCCSGSRCAAVFAGLWGLLFGGVYAVIAFLGISLYTCDLKIEFSVENPVYYLYFIYFFNRECSEIPYELDFETRIGDAISSMLPPNITIPPDFTLPTNLPSAIPTALPTWPEKFELAESTHDIMIAYAAINSAWFVTSILLTVAGAVHIRSSLAYIPWIIVTLGVIILDAAATIIYGYQADKSQTAIDLLELMGVQNIPEDLTQYVLSDNLDALAIIPSLVMALFASRLVILWIVDVVLLLCVCCATYRLTKSKGKNSKLQPYPYHKENNTSVGNNANNNNPNPNHEGNTNPGYVNDNIAHNSRSHIADNEFYSIGSSDHEYESGSVNNRPFSYTPTDPKMTSFQPRPQNQLQTFKREGVAPNNSIPRAGLYSPPAEPDYMECVEPTSWFHNPQKPSAPIDNNEPRSLPVLSRNHPETPKDPKPNYGNVAGPEWRKKAPEVPQKNPDRHLNRPQVSAIDLHRRPASYEEIKQLSRESSQTSHDRHEEPQKNSGSSATRLSGSMPPDELRSQLPWSYFGPRNAPMKQPKPKQKSVDEDIEKPPVPVPDYTLHFGKSQRPRPSGWSEDDASSTTSSLGNHHRQT